MAPENRSRCGAVPKSGRGARAHLLSDLLNERLRALTVTSLVLDDFADQLGLRLHRANGAVSHLDRELSPFERRWPLRLFRHRGPARLAVVGGLCFRDVVKACRLRGTSPSAVAPGAGRGEAKRVSDTTVATANTASFTSHDEHSSLDA